MLGALAATPQVAGAAVILPTGRSRRWHRQTREIVDEDWAQAPWFADYIEQVRNADGPAWREPIFTETVNTSTLLHDVPLRDRDGNFIGIYAQIVPVEELSAILSRTYSDTGLTPFVLYDRRYVLSHPLLGGFNEDRVLPTIEELGDLVLERIWNPDEEATYIEEALTNTQSSGIYWGEDFYLFLYRDVGRYGPAVWTVGAYLNTSLLTDTVAKRIYRALAAGLAVLVVGVLASILIGHKVSSPIKAIVKAANTVSEGNLESVKPVGGSRIRELDDASRSFNNMVSGLRERRLIRNTLGRFLPEEVATSLLAGGGELAPQQIEATILFCDIESFARLTEQLGPIKIVEVLNAYFSAMFDVLEKYGGVVTQFQGDAILATFNVPIAAADHARKALLAAREMLATVARERYRGERLNIRIGINTGTVVAGAIGAYDRLSYTVHGDAVNLAARLEAMNKEYGTRLLLSDHTTRLIDGVDFVEIGETTARGQTHKIKLYTLDSKPDEIA
jgi:class 3 adenylate cyclase